MSQCEAAESSSQVTPKSFSGTFSPFEVLRQGARQMLVKAVEAEVTAHRNAQHEVDQDGRHWWCATVRERSSAALGAAAIQAPRVDDPE